MNKTLKGIFLILAVCLLGYGIYILNPTENNDNSTSFYFIGAGFLSLILSLLKEKGKKK